MNNENLFSIIDFGSSKLRLGVYSNYLQNSKYISEEKLKCNFDEDTKEKSDDVNLSNTLEKLILNTESEINQHLKNITLLVDTPRSYSLDISIKKKLDKINLDEKIIKNLVNEAKILIENQYNRSKIMHLIISKYILDGEEYEIIPQNMIVDELIVELKFILIPNSIVTNLRSYFKKKHITINNIYNSSYIKSLHYKKYFEQFDIKVFLDIGFNKTSLIAYKNNKIFYINYIPIGGAHITKDISKIFKINLEKSEEIKQSLKQSNLTFLNDDSSKDLLIKVIHSRVEEIIDLSLKNLKNFEFIGNYKSVLIFTGYGSRILSKNSIYLKKQYDVFKDMNFFEETSDTICTSAYVYKQSDFIDEVVLIPKKPKERGLFGKLFYLFSR